MITEDLKADLSVLNTKGNCFKPEDHNKNSVLEKKWKKSFVSDDEWLGIIELVG